MEPPAGVTDGRDLDAGPEPRAVLADAPALVLEPAGRPSRREPPRRLAGSDVFLGIETREMLADDLVDPIARDPLGAGVPADHPALGIEDEDPVVRHARRDQAEALLAVADPGRLRQLAVGDVLRHHERRVSLGELEGMRRDVNVDDPAVLQAMPPLRGVASPAEPWHVLRQADVRDPHAQELGARIAVARDRGRVHLEEREALEIVQPHGERVRGEEEPEASFAVTQRLLGSLAVGDVAQERAEDGRVSQPHRRDRELHRKLRPVPAQRRQLDPSVERRALARRPEMREPTLVGRAVGGRNDRVGEAAAEDVRLRPAEQTLGLRIPGRDPALRVDRDDGVQRVGHEQTESLVAFVLPIRKTPNRLSRLSIHPQSLPFSRSLASPPSGTFIESGTLIEPKGLRDSLPSRQSPELHLGKTLTSLGKTLTSVRTLSSRCDSFLSGPFETRALLRLHTSRHNLRRRERRDQERKQTRGGQSRVSGNDASVLAPTGRPCGIETEVADSGARSWPAASGRGVLGRCERGP